MVPIAVVLILMISFGSFVVSLLGLVVAIVKLAVKNNRH